MDRQPLPVRPRCSVFIATSLDGFIARPDGSIDWLEKANTTMPSGEDCGYAAFAATVDVLVMGRHTFEHVRGFPEWPYGVMPVIVLSRQPVTIPPALAELVSVSSAPPEALVARLGREGARHLYIDGGITIQRFLAAGLIDDLTVTLIPVLLGTGKPLFGPLAKDLSLRLIGSRHFDFGFVQLQYRVDHTA